MRTQSPHCMKRNITPRTTKKATAKAPKNYYIDRALADVFQQLCEKNRQAGSPSVELENLMIEQIHRKGLKYGLKVPAHIEASL